MWKQKVVAISKRVTVQLSQLAGYGSIGSLASTPQTEGWTAYDYPSSSSYERRLWIGFRRSAQASAAFSGYIYYPSFMPFFHNLLDPNVPQTARRYGYEMRDTVYAIQRAGANEWAWGFVGDVAINYPTGLVGIGFRWGSDLLVKTFIRQGNAVPTTVVRETDTGISIATPRQLMLRINGWERKVEWWIDGVMVDSYVTVAPLGQMSSTSSNLNVDMRYRVFVPISGDASVVLLGESEATPILSLIDGSTA